MSIPYAALGLLRAARITMCSRAASQMMVMRPGHALLQHCSRAYTYIVAHKPYMMHCSFFDESSVAHGRQTLRDLGLPAGVFNVGRLDRDSEGLLILTDDGGWCHQICTGGVNKVYNVLVRGQPSDRSLACMAAGGLTIRGRVTRPCQVRRLDVSETGALLAKREHPRGCSGQDARANRLPNPRAELVTGLQVVLTEGMNRQVGSARMRAHPPALEDCARARTSARQLRWRAPLQVRRMTKHAGHVTLRLVRVGIGHLTAERLSLRPGEWCRISRYDVLGEPALMM